MLVENLWYGTTKLGGISWTVEVLDIPFPGKNQDGWCVGETSAAVTDGATPLADDWPQDVGDFARRAAELLVFIAGVPVEEVSPLLWKRVVNLLAQEYPPAGHKRTAGAAVVAGRGSDIVFSSVGDVQVLLQSEKGVTRLMGPKLPELDAKAQASEDPWSMFHVHRALANTDAGYPIVGDDPTIGKRAEHMLVSAHSVERFWIMSDGLWRNLPDTPQLAAETLAATNLAILADGGSADASPLVLEDDLTAMAFTRQ